MRKSVDLISSRGIHSLPGLGINEAEHEKAVAFQPYVPMAHGEVVVQNRNDQDRFSFHRFELTPSRERMA